MPSTNQDVLNRMCKAARGHWKDYQVCADVAPTVADIHRRRWDQIADACYSFAAKNGLRVRRGQTGGM